METNPLTLSDSYKICHIEQYPKDTEVIYSNLTPRSSRVSGIDKVVVFGLQYFVKEYLQNQFQNGFFNKPADLVISEYKEIIDNHLDCDNDISHWYELHKLGYLPLEIKAFPEGSLCPLRVPILTIKNTLPKFFWLTNWIETLLCNVIWLPITSATTALNYRRIMDKWANLTADDIDSVDYLGHDFSMRGHTSVESACASSAGHLLSFRGSDTIPVIPWLQKYYGADSSKEVISKSIRASEHSTMTSMGEEGEFEIFHRLLTEAPPSKPISIVSDSYNLWRVLTDYLPRLKDIIIAREGKFLCRPDSGVPEKIICGNEESSLISEQRGVVKLLDDIFGHTWNSKKYKKLHPNVGVVYGDGITSSRCDTISSRLADNLYASTNVNLGLGSYSYQGVTRDTYGLAFKATARKSGGKWHAMFKDPITDDGTKRSAKGLLMVWPEFVFDETTGKYHLGDYKLYENVTEEQEKTGCLQTVFLDGNLVYETNLEDIRNKLSLNKRNIL